MKQLKLMVLTLTLLMGTCLLHVWIPEKAVLSSGPVW